MSNWFIERLTERYPRHLIDQLEVVLSVIGNYPDYVDDALITFNRLEMTSANELRDIAISLEIESQKKPKKVGTINEKYKDFVAPERTTDIYLSVLQGGVNR
ncbi:hypothetical protein [Planococcus sp. 4-30]|uniref:hypothetical protein n=1 Tax=Planococcus sp. 4-30 TaxID=2874583 RepID=UPI001CBC0C23|nr:hypothetical protein [Planococcus sp. 4-30]